MNETMSICCIYGLSSSVSPSGVIGKRLPFSSVVQKTKEPGM